MPPKSNSERQKAYRQRLKNEKPDKYEEIRIKHLKKVKENIKKKKETLTEKDREEQRAKWRIKNSERAEKKKKAEKTLENNSDSSLQMNNKPKNKTKILKERLLKLNYENIQLKRRNKNLRQACNRMKRLVTIQKKQLQEQAKLDINDISIEPAQTLQCDDTRTPLTKTNSFLEETLPTISNAEKEKVKKKLLLLNTITNSLKTEYIKAHPNEKKVLKRVATSEIANKHKLKSKITHIFGLKGRIRKTKARNEIRMKYKKEIQDFFEREDVSRSSAGKNECITRNKEKVQKRYLLNPVYKLYKQYKAEGGKASLQSFYRFRPFYIVKPRLQDRNTCACIKHCNIMFKALSLKKLGVLNTSDIDELIGQITCSKSFKCMYSECSKCKVRKLAIDLTIDENSPVQWLQWKIGMHTYTKISKDKTEEKQIKKYSKQIVKGQVGTLIKEFQDDLEKFKTHYYNITHQYQAWKKCIKNLDEDEAAMVCDFSENFSCKQSVEIQAVHFGGSRNQVTLHTCVLYRKNEKPQSICSISPNNEHGPAAIWAHLHPSLKQCRNLNIKKIHIFSDSPATQYRQKNNFFMFQKMLKENGFEYATWNYFEASHGKGPADGVGGALKRQLDNHISHGNDITNAKEAYDYLLANSKVKIFYIEDKDIQDMATLIPDNVIPIKGTMKLHQIIMDGKEMIKYKWLSCYDCAKNLCCDCYYMKEHELVKINRTNEPETLSRRKKRPYTKIKATPAKRLKRINSSTTTESDIIMSSHSDSDLIDLETANDEMDYNTDDSEKNDSRLDFIGMTTSRMKEDKIQDTSKTEDTQQPTENGDIQQPREKIDIQQPTEKRDIQQPTENRKVIILSSVKLLPENRAFYDLQTHFCKLQPVSSTLNDKENEPEKKDIMQTNNNNFNPKVKKLHSEIYLIKTNADKNINKYQGNSYNIDDELYNRSDKTLNNPYENESQKKDLSYRKTVEQIDEGIQKIETYNCGDTVLTRYFKRSWKYYVGVIDKVNLNEKKYDVSYYKINGDKSNVKFTVPKYADRDNEVPEENIVKIIDLLQISENPIQYVLMNDEDTIYF